ncbi:MAG TPA: ATP-binding protein [Candidatus Acidoferrum sp.]|nr:ATP-binding protein [Candidatus Acidoferrum sp.]
MRSMQLFEGIPVASLRRIAAQLQCRRLPQGSVVTREGDPAEEFFLLTSGQLAITVAGGDPESPPVGTIQAPSWFGELGILTHHPRAATVTAVTESEVWTLSRGQFDSAVAHHPEMSRNLIATLRERIQRLDQDFLGQSALAIERARLLKDLRERNEELAALFEVTREVSASLKLDQILRTISTHAAQVTRSESASIFLHDVHQDVFEVCASYNTPEQYILETEELRLLGLGTTTDAPVHQRSLIARAVLGRTPIVISDIASATDYPYRDSLLRWGYRAILAVPLMRGDKVTGAMIVRRKGVGEFSAREIELVTTFARQSAIALENARLFREIQDKAWQLEEVSRHKSQFLAGMSHELRTPLNAIIGFSEVLLDPNMGSLPQEEQREFLTNILTSGKHLLRLINDVLDLSKVEAGKMELHPEAVSLAGTVEGVLATVKPLATKKHIRVSSQLDPDLAPARADPPRLKQILYNLLSNAIKFTTEGGRVTVSARAVDSSRGGQVDALAPVSQSGAGDRGGAWVEVQVADTGIGIPADQLGRIFEEFEQVADPTHPRQEGTGLGLALVKKLVELHGGTIRVTSTPGQGSTFAFTVPIARA